MALPTVRSSTMPTRRIAGTNGDLDVFRQALHSAGGAIVRAQKRPATGLPAKGATSCLHDSTDHGVDSSHPHSADALSEPSRDRDAAVDETVTTQKSRACKIPRGADRHALRIAGAGDAEASPAQQAASEETCPLSEAMPGSPDIPVQAQTPVSEGSEEGLVVSSSSMSSFVGDPAAMASVRTPLDTTEPVSEECDGTNEIAVVSPDGGTARPGHDHTSHGGDVPSWSVESSHASANLVLTSQVSLVSQDVSFRSSFLHHARPTEAVAGERRMSPLNLHEITESTAVGHRGNHLDIALKDSELGNFAIRAEVKDGLLHASVLGGHAATQITASALHQFLEQNQVSVHALRVEVPATDGARRLVSSSEHLPGSSSRNFSGSGSQRAPRGSPSKRPLKVGEASSVAHIPSAGLSGYSTLPVPFTDRQLSIHI